MLHLETGLNIFSSHVCLKPVSINSILTPSERLEEGWKEGTRKAEGEGSTARKAEGESVLKIDKARVVISA